MTLNIEFAPQVEAWIKAEAQQRGLLPADIVRSLVEERVAASDAPMTATDTVQIDAENAAAIAMLNRWVEEDATADPEEICETDEDVAELTRNPNANRAVTRESQVFA